MRRALLLIVLVACGHGSSSVRPERGPEGAESKDAAPAPDAAPLVDAPTPLAQDPAALAAGLVAVYEDVATATGAGDCGAIATAVGDLRAKHAELLDALRKADAAGRTADVKAALDPYKDRVKAALDTITQQTAACGKDPSVERALDSLFGT